MKAVVWLVGAGFVVAAAGGWFSAALPEPMGVRPPSKAEGVPGVEHAGLQIDMAYNQLQKLDLIPPAAPTAEADLPTAAPVDPIEVILRREISAIMGAGRSAQLVIVDAGASGGRKTFKVGQEFRDGWKFSKILPQEIVLQRNGEEKTVSIFGKLPKANTSPEPAQ